MRRLQALFPAFASAVLTACVAQVALAPGGEQVRITRTAADVANCAAVGNVRVPRNEPGLVDIATAEREFRNGTVGLGGNVRFVTGGAHGVPTEGIAYRCP